MKTDLLTFVKAESLLILYMLPFLLAAWYVIYRWGRKTLKRDQADERDYNRQYDDLQKDIEDYPIVPGNYEVLRDRIESLKLLPYKNPEKTDILENRLLMKFKTLIQEGTPFDDGIFNPASPVSEPSDKQIRKTEEHLALSN